MQDIEALKQEIQSYEVEIAKLKQELLIVGGRTLELASSNDPSAIACSFKEEAQKIIDHAPSIQGAKNAIAELTNRLQQKRLELQELETTKLKRRRSQRVKEGISRLQNKVADVEQAAESLKSLFFELKSLAREYEGDFSQISPPTSSRQMLNTASLLNFGLLTIPTLTENDGRFLLSSQTFDVFESEKAILQRQRAEDSRRSRQDHDDMMAQIRQREADEKLRTEREYRASLLVTKQQELKEFKSARGERLAALKSADVGYFDSVIAKLEAEIAALETK